MDEIKTHLKDISDIRNLMEQNTKFLSLSGLSGISAGICALAGAGLGYWKLHSSDAGSYREFIDAPNSDMLVFLVLDCLAVLGMALFLALFFSMRMAKKRDLPLYNATAQKLIVSLLVPLVSGGLFCIFQMKNGYYGMVPATMLLFYGVSLLNGSKYTLPEIRFLGLSEIVLGLFSAWYLGSGLYFWAFGFGVLHIIYGVVMYIRYER